MKQVLSDDIFLQVNTDYSPIEDEITSSRLPNLKTLFAFSHAFLPKIGDFSANYFNYLKILELLNSWINSLEGGESYEMLKTIVNVISFHLATQSLMNDLMLYVPAEEFQKILDYLTRNNSDLISEETSRPSPLGRLSHIVTYLFVYSSFALSSANSAVGILSFLPQSIPAKISGVILGLFITEMGVFYSHMVFTPRIQSFFKLMNSCVENFRDFMGAILKNPSIVLQILKSFGIISSYYTIVGVFYVYSLIEQLSDDFGFTVSDNFLMQILPIAGTIIFLANIGIRFTSTKERYFSPIPLSQAYIDIFQEFLISGAGLTLSVRRLPSPLAICGIPASIFSLGIGLKSIYLRTSREEKSQTPLATRPYSYLTHWLNFHSRFIKSTLLPFTALNKIFKLNLFDNICMTIMFAIPIGINSSKMYKRSIDNHINYLKVKLEYAKNNLNFFSGFRSLFTPSKSYPPDYQARLLATLD